ncbi:MAG: FAD-binding protein [Desulfobacterales bacterium]|nr:MAG: FAD-binding protein [Desulfobacterales bacterium]
MRPSDVLVIGGGGAGITAAIEAKEMDADVTLVSKSRIGYGNNTFISKAAISSVIASPDAGDSSEAYVHDATAAGRFINDPRLLQRVAQEGRSRIAFLEKRGVAFAQRHAALGVSQAPGHSLPRTVRSENQIGSDYCLPLREYARKIGVRFVENVFITRIFTSKDRFAAAAGITARGKFLAFAARCCVLATGGFAQLYLRNSNAARITGDGLVQAFELGIPLKDVEFVQFYPTATGPRGNRLLLYDAVVLRAGGVLRNATGEDIIAKHGPRDPLALTRDRLTRAIMQEILDGRDVQGGVIMDLSHVPEHYLAPWLHLLPVNRTPSARKFIVSPTAHYCMGGIVTDSNCATRIPGLYAAGEACAGVHGANRIAGNSLAEVFTMGGVAGRNAASQAKALGPLDLPAKEIQTEKIRIESLRSKGHRPPREYRRTVKEIMWNRAGIIRDRRELEVGLEQIQELAATLPRLRIDDGRELFKALELKNMLVLAEMVCRAALLRTESRGAHYRRDYPEEDNENWLKNIVIRKSGSGMRLQVVPVAFPGGEGPPDPSSGS